MAIEQALAFIGEEVPMTVKNAQALIDWVVYYVYNDEDETIFDFPSYGSSYLRVYQSKDIAAKMMKEFTTQITRNSNCQVLNCSELDMTFVAPGPYYYELGYIRSGGYDIVLRFGDFIVKR